VTIVDGSSANREEFQRFEALVPVRRVPRLGKDLCPLPQRDSPSTVVPSLRFAPDSFS
jgi:hypothetical protein